MKAVLGENFLRVALIAFNFIFSILSVSLIALGVVYSEQLASVEPYITFEFLNFPTLLLVLGSVSFVVSIVGCYCARATNRSFFIVFLLILTCLLAVELAVSVIAFINIDHDMVNQTKAVMVEQVLGSDYIEKDKFHRVEENLDCCGVDGPENYLEWENVYSRNCCGVKNCVKELESNESELWDLKGCAGIVAAETQQVAEEAAAVATVCSILQILEIACVYLMQGLIKVR